MYGVRTEETVADKALINRYDYDGIFGTGGCTALLCGLLWVLRVRGHGLQRAPIWGGRTCVYACAVVW